MARTPFSAAPASRRSVMTGLGAATLSLLARGAGAQAPGQDGPPPTPEAIAAALPVRSPGLDHVAMIVPDVGAAARFYSKVFNPDGLHKEQQGNLRYYVTLGADYIAIGDRASPPPPYLDHFCATVEDFDRAAMAARLAQEGLPQGRFGIFPDPNGIGLQLLGVPGGLAASTEPATRMVNGDAIVTPAGLEHVLLNVDDVDESAAFYAAFFDSETTRESEPDRLWIQIADTRIGLQRRGAIEPPRVEEFCVRVAPFDHAAVSAALALIGATVATDDEAGDGVLRFRDPYGLGVALKTA